MNYTIYRWDRTTNVGTVVRSGGCPDWAVAQQPRAGESVLAGVKLDPVHHYIRKECTIIDGVNVVTGPGVEVCEYAHEQKLERAGPAGREELLQQKAETDMVAQGVNPRLAAKLAERRRFAPAAPQPASP